MIALFFNILFFLVPLIFFKNTSELFEFNKIVTLYTFTTLIVSAWAIQSIRIKKLIFRKTILDWPLIIYLSIYLISSLLSIDPRTSWLGYYSRFNGGLVSQICYTLLYWAYVSNLDSKQALRTTYYILLATVIASILAIGERYGIFTTCGLMGYGISESCWVQDVQTRVFSTLGQPNWLAALLVALLPFTWKKSWKYYLLSILFFVTLLFTKSRSGLLAFGVESVIFWGFIFWKEKFKYVKEFIILFFASVIIYFVVNPPLVTRNLPETIPNGPALETGGTESGTIRKYVWLGAWEVFKHYPILGTGPETFAFSFPMFKPVGHNLTSEWDFIYNKAHNEFLNYLANTGILGFMSYLALIIYSIIIFWKSKRFDLLSGYVAILVTNFFGFSVVPVSLLFFLFPAISVASSIQQVETKKTSKIDLIRWVYILGVLLTTYYLLHTTYYYWKADTYFNSSEIKKALDISPNEPLYISKFASSTKDIKMATKALELAPFNQNARKALSVLLNNSLSKNENNYFVLEKILKEGIKFSPSDPKLYYQLGVLQLKIGKYDEAVYNLEKSVKLKPNYKEGRFALGISYIDFGLFDKAKENLEYILNYIDPNDKLTQEYLVKVNLKLK